MKNNKKQLEASLRKLVKQVLTSIDEDLQRDGLQETPKRVAKVYTELLRGYNQDPKKEIKLFNSNGFNELITVVNIDFYSLCEHHMIPFFGKVHIGYVPHEKILGLSKFARIVEIFSKRLQTQENLTKQILDTVNKYLKPKGLIVQIEAQHLCVSMRGIKNTGFMTNTVLKSGVLKTRKDLLNQFYRTIGKKDNK